MNNSSENAKENDLIRKNASQNDLWFHLENKPSPHAILEWNENVKNSDIYEAAQCVKDNSKFKDQTKIYVIYIKVKQVKNAEQDGSVFLKSKAERLLVY
jgi:predicted ribosome quality control (RQC) complex YloA/Tae2 family protein